MGQLPVPVNSEIRLSSGINTLWRILIALGGVPLVALGVLAAMKREFAYLAVVAAALVLATNWYRLAVWPRGEAFAIPAGFRFVRGGRDKVIPYNRIILVRHLRPPFSPFGLGRVEVLVEQDGGGSHVLMFTPSLAASLAGGTIDVVLELQRRVDQAKLAGSTLGG